ncbi:Zn-dependent hydrolase [Nodosilinea nodulosa]|uniref:Zn-dependent hydrolase n=1 Tax=Nodosilinea nodulosa TaxID=416001 RepID=UPI0002F409C5|nr:Zn-dependent hydrolase [Nodosilinea nodulosa]
MALLKTLSINGKRLNQSIDDLAQIGQLENGGIRRLAFSPEDLQGRELVRRWMVEAGLSICIDTAGNLIGRRPGLTNAPAIATGSHIDTVPCGGKFDGNLGVLAGIEVARTLQENNITLNHPFEVIVFADEEDTMIGSRAMAGTASVDAADYHRKDGRPMDVCIDGAGGNWEQLPLSARSRDDICAFVELHVEQGGVLETAQKQIGVVQGIVGMQRYQIHIKGRPNHAGTTPMDHRQDALVAAAQVVLTVNRLGKRPPGNQVATVGALQVWPNADNIVPGQVQCSLDVRDLNQDVINDLINDFREELVLIARETGTTIDLVPQLDVAPSPAADHIQAIIAEVSDRFGFSHMPMPSRAGHDALEMGRFTDMGMIFVPSEGGFSHSEVEYTTPEECVNGANVLLETVLRLDRHYS